MRSFSKIFTAAEPVTQIKGVSPRLASWNAKDHPDQIRLRSYLDDLKSQIGNLNNLPQDLFLDLRVDVGDKRKLFQHHDVENFITPLFGSKYFDQKRFRLVSGSKHVGGGSVLTIGTVRTIDCSELGSNWQSLQFNAGSGPTTKRWKERVNEIVEQSRPQLIPLDELIEFHMAFRCSPRRNWTILWKPTGDALSPILGYREQNKFNPYDDRITAIHFHRFDDETVGNDVYLGIWWRMIEKSSNQSLPQLLDRGAQGL